MQKEYTQTKEQVLEGLRTDRQGLSAQEAEKRLQEHGENRLKEAEKLTLFQRFVQQLKDPMLLILLAAAAVSAVTNILSHESFTEVIIILLVVLLNAVLGVVQESKAEAAIEALQTMTAATCKVLRDGQQVTMVLTLKLKKLICTNTSFLVSQLVKLNLLEDLADVKLVTETWQNVLMFLHFLLKKNLVIQFV